MRIAFVFSGPVGADQAGYRIRYLPLLESLRATKVDIIIKNINDDLFAEKFDCAIFVKCYEVKSFIIARELMLRRVKVGIDLFDNYFSYTNNYKLEKFRDWLVQICEYCSFVICSTNEMHKSIKKIIGNLPVHIINDTVEFSNANVLANTIKYKIDFAKKNKNIIVVWFGMGDNPYFNVGLNDLIIFIDKIESIKIPGYNIKLEILTNKRSLVVANLARISKFSIEYVIDEWSETKEAELLDRALFAFLPVSFQDFSKVKSLNRALTSLNKGVNIISAGYPLYSIFNDWIYYSSQDACNDIKNNNLKLNSSSHEKILEIASVISNGKLEAENLIHFLDSVDITEDVKKKFIYISDKTPNFEVHKIISKFGHISAASQFCKKKFNFDVKFTNSNSIVVNHKVYQLMANENKEKFTKLIGVIGYYEAPLIKFTTANNYQIIIALDEEINSNSLKNIYLNFYSQFFLDILPMYKCILN